MKPRPFITITFQALISFISLLQPLFLNYSTLIIYNFIFSLVSSMSLLVIFISLPGTKLCKYYHGESSNIIEEYSHCHRCDCCIYKRDHHCSWIDNCIGYANFEFYLMYLISTMLNMIFLGLAYYNCVCKFNPVVLSSCLPFIVGYFLVVCFFVLLSIYHVILKVVGISSKDFYKYICIRNKNDAIFI